MAVLVYAEHDNASLKIEKLIRNEGKGRGLILSPLIPKRRMFLPAGG